MIFYFSGTGNSQYVAETIGKVTGERAISIAECRRTEQLSFTLAEGERLGFVTPTYFLGLPAMVSGFIKKMEIKMTGKHYVYTVATYGTTPGSATTIMAKALIKKGIFLNGRFAVKMVDNWTPQFDCSDKKQCAEDSEAAIPKILEIADRIKNNEAARVVPRQIPYLIGTFYHKKYTEARLTSHLSVNDNCVGCQLCARHCPIDAIVMKNGKPSWTSEHCIMCLRCLHHCPTFAIQYDDKTQNHGQFQNPFVKNSPKQ